jgi:acylphosphatase
MRAVRLTIVGRVQGVGYRDWVVRTGRRFGLVGWVRNRTDGSVEALVAGEDAAVAGMIDACRKGPPFAEVTRIDEAPGDPADAPREFTRRPTV